MQTSSAMAHAKALPWRWFGRHVGECCGSGANVPGLQGIEYCGVVWLQPPLGQGLVLRPNIISSGLHLDDTVSEISSHASDYNEWVSLERFQYYSRRYAIVGYFSDSPVVC